MCLVQLCPAWRNKGGTLENRMEEAMKMIVEQRHRRGCAQKKLEAYAEVVSKKRGLLLQPYLDAAIFLLSFFVIV